MKTEQVALSVMLEAVSDRQRRVASPLQTPPDSRAVSLFFFLFFFSRSSLSTSAGRIQFSIACKAYVCIEKY